MINNMPMISNERDMSDAIQAEHDNWVDSQRESEIEKLQRLIRDEEDTIRRCEDEIKRLNTNIGYAGNDIAKYKALIEKLSKTDQ